jgi:hypothetical protein
MSNSKTYWKIMKLLIKSNKGCSNIPHLQNIIQDEGLEQLVCEDDERTGIFSGHNFNIL